MRAGDRTGPAPRMTAARRGANITMRARWGGVCGLAGLLASAWVAGCAARIEDDQTLTIFAAASLAEVFQAVGDAHRQANPAAEIVFNFAASDQLAQQLLAGSPADLFASADQVQMQIAVDAGLVDEALRRVFARNRMVIVVPSDNPAAIASLADLARPGVRLVLAAPEVPAGHYARLILARASADAAYGPGFEPAVLANVRSLEENVRAVLAKVVLGEADAGIVYLTDALTTGRGEAFAIEIPSGLNAVTEYWIAPLSGGTHPEQAEEFLVTLLSAEGQSILARYGFEPVGP